MDTLLKLYYISQDGKSLPFPNTESQVEITSFTYNSQRMGGAPTISATLMFPICLDGLWSDSVYTVFNNERYFLKQTPTSSKNNEDVRYKHNIEFVSERIVLDNIYFFDTVANDLQNDRPVSNSTKMVFHGDIYEFAQRLNYSLVYTNLQKVDEEGNYESGYRVIVDDGIISEEVLMSFENQFITNVLQDIYNKYELPYYFNGKDIHIGFNYTPSYSESTQDPLSKPFEYGHNGALLSITKSNTNNKIVNKCSGFGSSENIEYYYPNNSPKGKATLFYNGVENNEKIKIIQPIGLENVRESDIFKYVVEPQKYESSEWTLYTPFEQNNHYWLDSGPDCQARKEYANINVAWVFEHTFSLDNTYENLTLNLYTFRIDGSACPAPMSDIIITCNGEDVYKESRLKERGSANETNYLNISISHPPVGGWRIRYRLLFTDHPTSSLQMYGFNAVFQFKTPEKRYWVNTNAELDDTEKNSTYPNLERFGLKVYEPNNNDTVNVTFKERILTSDNLMPPIYRISKAKERFYKAKNYPFAFYNGYELDYGEYIENNEVHNDAFKNELTGEYYVFANEFYENTPKEHIAEYSDIRPTIKDVTNGVRLYITDEDGNPVTEFQRIDMFADFAYDKNDNDDKETNDEGVGYKHPYFYAKLRKMSFNLFDCLLEGGDAVKISMTSGRCGACSFEVLVNEETKKNPVKVDENGNLVYDENGNVNLNGNDERQQDTLHNEVWICLKKDKDTFGTLMPNATHNYKPQKAGDSNNGDTFVLLNISLPQEYILNAEKELEKQIIKYLALNNEEKFTFSIKFSRIFFAENPNYLKALNENVRIKVIYNGQTHDLYVSDFSYKVLGNEVLPEVIVTLKDEIAVSQTSLQKAIDKVQHDLMSGIGSIDWLRYGRDYFLRKDIEDTAMENINFHSGATFGIWEEGVSGAKIDANGHEEVDSIDVRKGLQVGRKEDGHAFSVNESGDARLNTISTNNNGFSVDENGNVEAGTIVVKDSGGIMSDNFERGTMGKGFGMMSTNANGHSYLEVDKLLVRLKAIFTELQIHSIKYSGGSFVFSPAGMTVAKTEVRNPSDALTDSTLLKLYESGGEDISAIDDTDNVLVYRCYFTNKDGETKVKNEFAIGDLVRSQSFNVVDSQTNVASNILCWRECVGVGYDYIDLWYGDDEDDPNGEHHALGITGYPQEGDNIVTFGNNTDTERQNVIYMNAHGGVETSHNEAPCIVQYKGINSFSVAGKIVTKISPQGNLFTGKDFIVETDDGKTANLFSMAQNGIELATKAKDTADKAILQMTPENISLALIDSDPIINYFVNGSFEDDDIVKTGNGSIVSYDGSFHGNRCFYVTTPGWDFTLGNVKVGIGTYTFIFRLQILSYTDGERTDIFKLQSCEDGLWQSNITDITFDAITLPTDESWITYRWAMTFDKESYIRFSSSGYGFGSALRLDALMLLKGDYLNTDIPKYVDYYNANIADDLLKTGIDVKERKITLTADQFEVKNNSDETTATINEDGVLEMNSGVFKGRLSLPFRQLFFEAGDEEEKQKNIANGFEIAFDGASPIYRITDLNKGANVCVIGTINSNVADGLKLPILPKYNGTLVTIVKVNKDKSFQVTIDELENGMFDGVEYNSNGHYIITPNGHNVKAIVMNSQADFECLQLMAVKTTPDYTETNESADDYGNTYEGICAWMVLNPERYEYNEEQGHLESI